MEPLRLPKGRLQNEEFRLIANCDGLYCVSNYGRVYSRWSKGRQGSFAANEWKQLKPQQVKGGYFTVTLRNLEKVKTIRTVHTLVIEAFKSPRPKGYDIHCRHLDGNPENNYVDNLAWGTRSDNTYDSIRHGTFNHPDNTGEQNGQAKLTEEAVKQIRFRAFLGTARKDLAAEYGVTRSCINLIAAGKSWGHL